MHIHNQMLKSVISSHLKLTNFPSSLQVTLSWCLKDLQSRNYHHYYYCLAQYDWNWAKTGRKSIIIYVFGGGIPEHTCNSFWETTSNPENPPNLAKKTVEISSPAIRYFLLRTCKKRVPKQNTITLLLIKWKKYCVWCFRFFNSSTARPCSYPPPPSCTSVRYSCIWDAST